MNNLVKKFADMEIYNSNESFKNLKLNARNIEFFFKNRKVFLTNSKFPFTDEGWKNKYMLKQDFNPEDVKFTDFNWNAIFNSENPDDFIENLCLSTNGTYNVLILGIDNDNTIKIYAAEDEALTKKASYDLKRIIDLPNNDYEEDIEI